MPPTETPETHCQVCGARLDSTILGGSCSACMWSDLISGEIEATEAPDDTPDIEGYDVLEEIGHGGMGVVFRARQHQPDREVALKIVAPYSLRVSQARERFMIEVEAMAAVEHPGLLPLYDTGEDIHGRPWLTMQLAHGGTLAERLDSYSEKWKKVASLMVTLCQAVQYAHERGILHRDLKPANILFDGENNPYIADFGLAKWADEDSSITRSSYLLGSPAYLAPEAAAGGSKVTTTVSDVYGLGAILYELLCGRKPYEGTQVAEIITQILDRAPVSPKAKLSGIPRDLEVIVMKAMAREPEKRYHSAAAFADDLNRWLEGKIILARPVSSLERCWIWAKRNPALFILSLLLFTSLATGGILLWQSNKELAVALNDAENRVEFMTRELPASLEPLGRLDLLDDVFLNVSEHYDMDNRTDSNSLARHADFLTQWSQILRPRGQVKEAIVKLDRALEKAEAATQGGHFSIEAARARVSAGRRLGEALIEDHAYERARSILNNTIAFSKSLPREQLEDLRLSNLIAELILESAILDHYDGRHDDALTRSDEAMNMWETLVPRLMKNPDSPHNQRALITAAKGYYFLFRINQALNDENEASVQLGLYLKRFQDLVRIFPDNLHFQRDLVVARQLHNGHLLKTKAISAEEAIKTYKEIDADITLLVAQAPSNIRWRTDHVTVAFRLSEVCEEMNDEVEREHWMREIGERMNPLYKIQSTDLKFLYAHRESATMCARYFAKRDWGFARHHFTSVARIQIQICRIDTSEATHRSLQKGTRHIAALIMGKEGKKTAAEWLSTRVLSYEQEATRSKFPHFWKWSMASCFAQASVYFEGGPESHTAAKKSFDILISLSSDLGTIPEFPEQVHNAVSLLLNSATTSSTEKNGILTSLLKVMPHLRSQADAERDKQWLELILEHISEITPAIRKVIIDRTISEFFPKPDPDNSHYQQLQQLR